jgi:hypothetical protein
MKTMIAVLAFMMLSQAQAQTGQTQVNRPAASARPTMVYDERTNELSEVRPAQVVQAVPAQVAPAQAQPQPTGSPIYILNNQNQRFNGSVDNNANSQAGARQESAQVQEQPTTIVQDTPLRAGVADSARRSRQETEAATEDGIVQALEKARMNDEIRRREKFSNALSGDGSQSGSTTSSNQSSTVTPLPVATPVQHEAQAPAAPQPIINVVIPQQPAAPAPVVIAPQPPVVIEEAPARTTEIRAQAPESAPVEEMRNSYYVSGLVGMAKYPDVVNIRGNMAAGVAVGIDTASRFSGEVSFLYSSYELQDIFSSYYNGYSSGRMVDMTQYNLALAGKYNILTGRLRPFVGVVGSYTRRNYYDQWTGGYNSESFRNSNAFDAGGLAGVDFALTERFAIGADFRYYTNVYMRQSTNYPSSFQYGRMNNEIERLDYYTAGVTAKYTF